MNIYISKDNEAWLRLQDRSMSGIINNYLDECRQGLHGPHVLAKMTAKEWNETSTNIKPDIKQPAALSSNGRITGFDPVHEGSSPSEATKPLKQQKYCKNGHPLDERGRCFGKGCKYA